MRRMKADETSVQRIKKFIKIRRYVSFGILGLFFFFIYPFMSMFFLSCGDLGQYKLYNPGDGLIEAVEKDLEIDLPGDCVADYATARHTGHSSNDRTVAVYVNYSSTEIENIIPNNNYWVSVEDRTDGKSGCVIIIGSSSHSSEYVFENGTFNRWIINTIKVIIPILILLFVFPYGSVHLLAFKIKNKNNA